MGSVRTDAGVAKAAGAEMLYGVGGPSDASERAEAGVDGIAGAEVPYGIDGLSDASARGEGVCTGGVAVFSCDGNGDVG
jgi:hypothetical protein